MGYIPGRLIASNSMATFRRELKKVLKCIIVSSKHTLTVDDLNEDFIDVEGRPIPYAALSYQTLRDYIESLKDTFVVEPTTGIIRLVTMPGVDKSYHMQAQDGGDGWDTVRERFVYPNDPPTKQLPRWTLMDIINQIPFVDFDQQKDTVVLLNRNKGGMTLEDFKKEMKKVLKIGSVDQEYRCVERLLDKLSHFVYVSGDRVFADLAQYDIHVNDLGLNPYYVPDVPVIPDSLKDDILKLLVNLSHGMWAQFLAKLYENTYGYPLDYWTFGFETITQFLATLPTIFRLERFGGYFRIYATKNLHPPEPGVPELDRRSTLSLLARFTGGVDINYFQQTYQMLHGVPFSIEPMRFENLREALDTLRPYGVLLEKDDEETMVKLSTPNVPEPLSTVSPFTSSADGFNLAQDDVDSLPVDCYPNCSLRPGDMVPRLSLTADQIKTGNVIEIDVRDICGPEAFFASPKNGVLDQLQAQLNAYYKERGPVHKMPFKACVKGLFCITKRARQYGRVVVVDEAIVPQQVVVLCIDYGCVLSVEKSSLYYLVNEFAKIPNQAFFCYIANIEPNNIEPTNDCRQKFTAECDQVFKSLIKKRKIFAKIRKLNLEKLEMGIYLMYPSEGSNSVTDIRRVLVDGHYANVSYRKPVSDETLYATWCLYTSWVC